MVRAVGIHVVNVERLARALVRRGARLERRLFGRRELADCASRRDRTTALAARCAAKGACIRALGGVWSSELTPLQIQVERGAGGRPSLRLAGRAAELSDGLQAATAQVSLSHDGGLAVAVVILQG